MKLNSKKEEYTEALKQSAKKNGDWRALHNLWGPKVGKKMSQQPIAGGQGS